MKTSRWRRLGFYAGMAIMAFAVVLLLLPPEAAPRWVQKAFYGIPVITSKGEGGEVRHEAFRRNLWVGREVVEPNTNRKSRLGQLQFGEGATRGEAAYGDTRVDARAGYRGFLTAVGFLGAILALLCLGAEVMEGLGARLARPVDPAEPATPEVKPEGCESPETSVPAPIPTPVAPTPEEVRAKEKKEKADVAEPEKPAVPEPTKDAEVAPEEEKEAAPADSHRLVCRWEDETGGIVTSHTLTVEGEALLRATGAKVYFDLGKDGRLGSTKAEVGLGS